MKKEMEGADERDIVHSSLDFVMSNAIIEVQDTAEAQGISLRVAAYVNALRRVNATQLAGQIGF